MTHVAQQKTCFPPPPPHEACFHPVQEKLCIDSSTVHRHSMGRTTVAACCRASQPSPEQKSPQLAPTSARSKISASLSLHVTGTADRAAQLQECCGQPGERLRLSAGEVQEAAEHGAEADSRSLVLLVGGLTGLLLLLSEVAAVPSAVPRSRAIGFPPCTCKSHSSCVQASKSDISREQAPSWSQYIN